MFEWMRRFLGTSGLAAMIAAALLIGCSRGADAGDAASGGAASRSAARAAAAGTPPQWAQATRDAAPVVLYTDALSGPTSGGEHDAGAYLSIFGKNFGSAAGLGSITRVYIGDAEVANYRYLGPSKVAAQLGIEQIVVQVGSLGGAKPGLALPVKVVVGSKASNTDQRFTPNPGRMLFAALDGNDLAAKAGDITKPWRYLQTWDPKTNARGGLYADLRAGDHIVIRGGRWRDQGFQTAWLRFRDPHAQGSPPTGNPGSGWIHITAYPGPIKGHAIEDVHYSTPAGAKGGIHGPGSAYFRETGSYVSISNLRIDVDAQAASDAAPFNEQFGRGPWRVVNNEAGPWPSTLLPPNNAKAAGYSGHGRGTKVLGNHIHDIACVGVLENHGIYIDSGARDLEVAYNWIHDIPGGNLIQFYDNVGLVGSSNADFDPGWTGFTGMLVHHNWLEGSGKYGLNLASGIVSGAFWNNVVIGASYAGLRIDSASKNMDLTIAFNTFYDNDRKRSGSGNAQVLNSWGAYGANGVVRVVNNVFAAGPNTWRRGSFYEQRGESDDYLYLANNLWWDNGYGWPRKLERERDPQFGDPRFAAPLDGDFSLQSGSPAIDAAVPAVLRPADDLSGLRTRPQGKESDLGALERPAR